MPEPSHALLEKLIDRRLAPLQEQLRVQHCLLQELLRQMPPQALLQTARQLELLPAPSAPWHLYVCQLAGLVDGPRPRAAGR